MPYTVNPPIPSSVSPAARSRFAWATTSVTGPAHRRGGGVVQQDGARDGLHRLQRPEVERPVERVDGPVAHLVELHVGARQGVLLVAEDEHPEARLGTQEVVDDRALEERLDVEPLRGLLHPLGARAAHAALGDPEPGRVGDDAHLGRDLGAVGE